MPGYTKRENRPGDRVAMINTIWGSTQKPVACRQLADFFTSNSGMDGTLYISYPVIGTPEGAYPIDALLLSREVGLVVFNVVEGRELGEFAEAQDESYTKLQSKLLQHKTLLQARTLKVPMHVTTFAPAVHNVNQLTSANYPICDLETIQAFLDSLEPAEPLYFPAVMAVIQTISSIRKGRKKREVRNPQSRGSKLKALEESIANLDNIQSAAVIETFDGVQRIRGLAGSGKTIILALKVAYLHARHPEWKIAVTFNTRSLKGQFERLINTFVIEQTNEEPDWENVKVIHAWGAPGDKTKEGIYYNFCRDHGVEYFDFKMAQSRFGINREFEGACEKALQDA